ncbi:MAG: hypothetical protein ACE5OZ_08010 [Candidatus Heimdallarchaeota archaeon]
MKLRSNARSTFSRIPLRRAIILGFLLGWALLSTVIPVPAPPPGSGGVGPG